MHGRGRFRLWLLNDGFPEGRRKRMEGRKVGLDTDVEGTAHRRCDIVRRTREDPRVGLHRRK